MRSFVRPRRCVAWTTAALLALGPALRAADDDAAGQVDFRRDIRPILADNCFHCHGPDESTREAGLRLDTEEGIFAALRRSRKVVTPGDPEASELWLRVTAADPDDRMPPAESGKSLDPEEVALLGRWIRAGAEWHGHWSFVPPARPSIPAVAHEELAENPIDHFTFARMEAAGLAPAPEADPYTLIRRVTFDLTGLPPTPEDADAFVHDPDPNAYEKVVDRLLRSPAYGEHMARYWLDAARYGDTHGLHLDNLRVMWPYRDWVIRAYNDGMPFDRFTIEQLAGDLLPDPTLDQFVATGFNRCNVTTSEGGAIDQEFLVRYAVDRVETTSTVWMGLTAGCAACHDHKFDPLTQKEFYELFAFFNSITEPAMDGNAARVKPFVEVPFPGVPEERDRLAGEIARLESARAARRAAIGAGFDTWLARAESDLDASAPPPSGLLAHFPLDDGPDAVRDLVDPQRAGARSGAVASAEGQHGGALRFDGGHIDVGQVGAFEADDAFSYGAFVKTPGNVTGSPFGRMNAAEGHRGWDVYIVGRKVAMHLIHRWSDVAIKVTTKEDVLEPNRWHHVFVTYDGSRRAQGVTLWVDGVAREYQVDADSLAGGETTVTPAPMHLGKRRTDAPFTGGFVDDVRVYDRELSAEEVGRLSGLDPLRSALAKPAGERTDRDRALLEEHWLGENDPEWTRLTAALAELRRRDGELEGRKATTLIMEERAEPRPAYRLHRGEYDQERERVERDTPDALPPMPEDAPRNRLGLARWLVDPRHPLTARVAVNRYWQMKFGTGIVRTQEDFGNQGSPPSHPMLLDWLAVEFVESDWNVKHLHKLIVMSHTYRQSARATPELLALDPENRLFARGPRFRLDAEAIRDQALFTSGLLVEEMGGPSVKPPQPAGLWYAVGYTSSNTARFQQDDGAKTYRRGVYTFWKRTAPPPMMTTFDAPSRESCTVRRERTNTPLQALLLLNDQQYVESARHLAARVLREVGDGGPEAIATRMFRLAATRPPAEADVTDLVATYREQQEMFAADPDAAAALLAVGDSPRDESIDPVEHAAWTLVANLILNLDEVVVKG